MSLSPRLGLSYILPAQAQKHVSANESFRKLDALVHLTVKSTTQTAQPAAPAEGDCYIIPSGATGAAWSAMAVGAVASYQDGQWFAYAPRAGWRAYVEALGACRLHNGSAWVAESNGVAVGGNILDINLAANNTSIAAANTLYDIITASNVVIPATGRYLVTAALCVQHRDSAPADYQMRVHRDATALDVHAFESRLADASNDYRQMFCSRALAIAAGTYSFKVGLVQTTLATTGALVVANNLNNTASFLQIERLS